MAGPWQTWLGSITGGTLTYRHLAAAVEYALRALETRKLLPDVTDERTVIELLSWPVSMTDPDRVAMLDKRAPAGVWALTLGWLSTAARVLDDHGATVDGWPDFRDTVNGVGEVTARERRLPPRTPARGPGPAPASPPATYRALVLSWPLEKYTRTGGVEVLSWLQGVVLRRTSLTDDLHDALVTLAIGDQPTASLQSAAGGNGIGVVLGVALSLADEADAAHIPMQPYLIPTNAWALALELVKGDPTVNPPAEPDDVPPPTTRDLPTTPPQGSPPPPRPAPAPAGGIPGGKGPGPYVDTFNKFRVWAATTNRPLDGDDPRLTREQAAAVLRYIVNRARTSLDARDPATKAWLPIALALLGWTKRGDAFNTTSGWRTGWTPQPVLGQLWAYVLGICRQLDALGVKFEGPHPSPTVDYGVMAQEAQAALVADDPSMAPPVFASDGPAPTPDAPSPATPKPPPGGGGSDLGMLALLLLIMQG